MRLVQDYDSPVLRWTFEFERGDRLEAPVSGGKIVRRTASFVMPESWSPEALHPDAFAAAVLLAVQPLVGRRLSLPWPVSHYFAEVVRRLFDIRLRASDGVERRENGPGRAGIAFSGGIDSVAALSVLPRSALPVFLERSAPVDVDFVSAYRSDSARDVCDLVESRGWTVERVVSDIEYMRSPTGYWVIGRSAVESPGVPMLLLADHYHLDAVCWGTSAEETYATGIGHWMDHANIWEHRRWYELLAAVGLPVLNVIAGMSGVASAILASDIEAGAIARSCVRGTSQAQCMNCWKCLRSVLARSGRTGEWPSPETLDSLLLARGFRQHLRRTPLHWAPVLHYGLARCPYDTELIELLRARLAVREPAETAFMERWYSPAAELWPERYRESAERELDARIGRMSPEEEIRFRRWAPELWEQTAVDSGLALATARRLDALAEASLAKRLKPLPRPFLDRYLIEPPRPQSAPRASLLRRVRRLAGRGRRRLRHVGARLGRLNRISAH